MIVAWYGDIMLPRVCLIIIPLFLLQFACVSTKKSNAPDEQERLSRTTGAYPEKRHADAPVVATFIDTLNQGTEVALTEEDFGPVAQKSPTTGSSVSEENLQEHYRVQVFASNHIDAVRDIKKDLETRSKAVVDIGYDAPYYKVYAGDFSKRTDAEQLLKILKKRGYSDAWVVIRKNVKGR